jgi:hypothetical protein
MSDSTRDLVVTVPQKLWLTWLAEGDLPGDPPAEAGLWDFYQGAADAPHAEPGARVYVVAHGMLRGYAPLKRIERQGRGFSLVRGGGAVACTLAEGITGFQGVRYRWWARDDEHDFPAWATLGLPRGLERDVRALLELRARGAAERAELRRRALGGLPLFAPMPVMNRLSRVA